MQTKTLKLTVWGVILLGLFLIRAERIYAQVWAITVNKTAVVLSKTKNMDTLECAVVPTEMHIRSIVWSSDSSQIVSVKPSDDSKKAILTGGAEKGWTTINVTIEVEKSSGPPAVTETKTAIIQVQNKGNATESAVPVTGISLPQKLYMDSVNSRVKVKVPFGVLPEDASNKGVLIKSLTPEIVGISRVASDTIQLISLNIGVGKIEFETMEGGFKDTVTVKVVGIHYAVKSILPTPLFMELTRSDEAKEFSWQFNPPEATNKKVKIRVADPQMGTVALTGNMTATFSPNANVIGEISDYITIVSEEDSLKQAVIPVKVKEDRWVSFNAKKIKKMVGDPSDNDLFEKGRADLPLIFQNSDPNVVSISDEGVLSYLAAGKATIIATPSPMGIGDTLVVEVLEVMPKTIELNEYAMTLYVPSSGNIPPIQLVATLLPENTTEKQLIWRSSNPLATVTQTGKVSFPTKNAGKVQIIVASRRDTSVKAVCHITIKVPLRSVKLAEKFITIHQNDHEALLTAELDPQNPTDLDLHWSVQSADDSSSMTGLMLKPLEDLTTSVSLLPKEKGKYLVKVEDAYTKLFDTCIVRVIDEADVQETPIFPLQIYHQFLREGCLYLGLQIPPELREESLRLTLFDLLGRQKAQTVLFLQQEKIDFNWEISPLTPGAYYLLFQTAKQIQTLPIIKNP